MGYQREACLLSENQHIPHAFASSLPSSCLICFFLCPSDPSLFCSLHRFPALSSSYHSSLPPLSCPLPCIIEHSFPFHYYFLSPLPPPFSSPQFSVYLDLGTRAPPLRPLWFILIKLDNLICQLERGSSTHLALPSFHSPRSPFSPSLSWVCHDAHMKHHLLHSSRRRVSILLLWGGGAQWVPGGNVACLDNLIY